MLNLNDIKNMKVTVMGLGLHGGGLASAKFFADYGANVTVTDMKTEEQLSSSVNKLAGYKNIRFVLGRHEEVDFENADIVLKNPGVKRAGNKFLKLAKRIESDISIFLQLSEAPILAVTGSKGKSSTVSALYYGLIQAGYNAFLGGNITVSPLTFWEKTNKNTPVVLELSSWQLNDLYDSNFSPKVVIMTPIMPDHQNWYDSMGSYVADKKIIYKNQTKDNFIICNADDKWGKIFAAESSAKTFWYSLGQLHDKAGVYFNSNGNGVFTKSNGNDEILLMPNDCKVIGRALRQNLLNASLAMMLYGVDVKKIPAIMKDYPGLEHRLEFFYEADGLRFYNDTTATVPEAVVAALEAFTEPPVLIAGGANKNLDYTVLAKNIHKAKKIFLLRGSGTDLLIEKLKPNAVNFEGPFNTLKELVEAVHSDIQKNREDYGQNANILFSPGGTSFEMFNNEFDRGNQFKQFIKEIF